MTTYSYCPDYKNQKCIKNYYMYINPYLKCASGYPVDGWMLDVDKDCEAEEVNVGQCPKEYVSYEGRPVEKARSYNLGVNKKCTISVDATKRVARVTFS